MAYYAVHDAAGVLVSHGSTTADPLPEGLVRKNVGNPPGRGLVWDPQALDFVPEPVAEGLPRGALVYVLDPADPLGLPVDAQRATDPAPGGGKTTKPVRRRPTAADEWDAADGEFAPAVSLADRITHDPMLAIAGQWHALAALAEAAEAAAWPAEVRAVVVHHRDVALRKIYLLARAQALLS
jgi:hypothetical protein